ncbi:MAG: branched-chain amino acid ABC transporter permease [Chloroflexota bacterium]
MTTTQIIQQIINAISLGAIYALFSLGYALVLSVLGVLNLSHSAVFSWGAIFGLIMVKLDVVGTRLSDLYPDAWGWAASLPAVPLWLAFPAALLMAGLLAVAVERLAFYPLRRRNAPRLSQLISSIGMAIVLVNAGQWVMQQTFGNTLDYFPGDIATTPAIEAFEVSVLESTGVRISFIRALITVIALGLMILLQTTLIRTKVGRAVRATAFSDRIAALLGVNTEQVYLLTFFLAGVLGGAAGMLYGIVFTNVQPFMGDAVSLVGLVAIVLGGMGSISGAVLGGFLVAALQTFSVAAGSGSYRNTVIFLLLFIVLVVRPQGILGQERHDRA